MLNTCLAGWKIEHNYEFNKQGKIWVCWKPSIGTVRCIEKKLQFITLEVSMPNGGVFTVTVVYVNTDIIRWEHWETCNINVPWIVMGDSNSILNSQERVQRSNCIILQISITVSRLLV